MAAFNKSNWTRTASAEHARVYMPAAIPSTAVNFGQQSNIVVTVPWQFQGNGQIQVTLPAGVTINSQLEVGQASLIAPSGTTYSGGGSTNHPRIQFQILNVSNATNATPAATDCIAVQY